MGNSNGRRFSMPPEPDAPITHFNKKGQLHSPIDPLTKEALPAMVTSSGVKVWMSNGLLHNSDKDSITGWIKPAYVSAEKTVFFIHGECLVSDVQPAIIYANGDKVYSSLTDRRVLHGNGDNSFYIVDSGTEVLKERKVNGVVYRYDENQDLILIKGADGSFEKYFRGKKHAFMDPAVVTRNGDKEWWENGELHRIGGLPAIERVNGEREYWLFGKRHNPSGPAIVRPNGDNEYWVNGKRVALNNIEIENECCVCYTNCKTITTCLHPICLNCRLKLRSDTCPMCTRNL